MNKITLFTKKTNLGYMGYARIKQDDMISTENTGISRLTREDALLDAKIIFAEVASLDKNYQLIIKR